MTNIDRREEMARLLDAAAEKGVHGPAELGRVLGMSEQVMTNWAARGVSKGGAIQAQELLGISSTWVQSGRGPRMITGVLASTIDAIPYNASKVRDVFVVGRGNGGLMPESIWTDGGYPVGATDECAEVATTDVHAFLVRVEGASMVPRYNPGEFALVEPGTAPDLEDDVLVRLKTGHTMIKRLLSRRDGYLFGSYNSGGETKHFKLEDVSWVYYIAHPVPRRKIKARC